MRVILARITGDAAADYQMAFWPVRKNGKHPQTISSPAATRGFADIGPLPGLKFAYHLGADGYTLEAAVPLKSLELDPPRHPTVGFDASVGFPDAGGRVRASAAHWAGQSEAAVVDRLGSAALLGGNAGHPFDARWNDVAQSRLDILALFDVLVGSFRVFWRERAYGCANTSQPIQNPRGR